MSTHNPLTTRFFFVYFKSPINIPTPFLEFACTTDVIFVISVHNIIQKNHSANYITVKKSLLSAIPQLIRSTFHSHHPHEAINRVLTARWGRAVVLMYLIVRELNEGIVLFCELSRKHVVVFFSNFRLEFPEHTFTDQTNLKHARNEK